MLLRSQQAHSCATHKAECLLRCVGLFLQLVGSAHLREEAKVFDLEMGIANDFRRIVRYKCKLLPKEFQHLVLVEVDS